MRRLRDRISSWRRRLTGRGPQADPLEPLRAALLTHLDQEPAYARRAPVERALTAARGGPSDGEARTALIGAAVYAVDRLHDPGRRNPLLDALRAVGVVIDDPIGRPYDPAVHIRTTVMIPERPEDSGSVAAVERLGFSDGDTTIRLAEVVVWGDV